jgi:hypothetical protein
MKVLSSIFICLCMLFEEFHVRFVDICGMSEGKNGEKILFKGRLRSHLKARIY